MVNSSLNNVKSTLNFVIPLEARSHLCHTKRQMDIDEQCFLLLPVFIRVDHGSNFNL